jgi:hypothetical protein
MLQYICWIIVIIKGTVLKTENNGGGDPLRSPSDNPLPVEVGTNYADKLVLLVRYSSVAD